ncbi:Fibronectin type III [Trinorchestia longiramus]|nr:Fibronectin type III [Trinorchestia longiramus]
MFYDGSFGSLLLFVVRYSSWLRGFAAMTFTSLFIITLLSSVASPQELHPLSSLGCFVLPQSSSSNHTLIYSHDTEVSGARVCVTVCREKQFRYAGIVAQKKCMCGLTFRGESSDGCRKCTDNPQHLCGGDSVVSVYETGGSVPGPPLYLNLLNQTSEGLYITWGAPISDGSPEILQYQVIATPLDSLSGLEPPSACTWELGEESRSAWLSGVHPATHYTVEVRAANTEGLGSPARTEGWTSIDAPPVPSQPEILSRMPESITVKLHMVNPVGGPITAYQIVVVDETVGAIMNPSALTDYYNASKQELPYYITAQFSQDDFQTVFIVGDKKIYDGYYNAPLKTNVDYHILLGVISTLNKTLSSYSPSDHSQHLSSNLGEDPEESVLPHSNAALQNTGDHDDAGVHTLHHTSNLTFGLSISVGLLGCLVLIAALVYIGLRVYLRAPRRPDHQELTANCHDNGELPANGLSHYLNEEDLPDHYSRLKQRVAVMRPADLTIVGDVGQGSFGAIKKGVLRSSAQVHSANHTEGAVLVHHILDSSLCARDKAAMLRSLGQHVSLGQHKHIVALLGLVEHVTAVSLVFEYETHSLKQQLTDARALTHYPVYAEKHRRFSTIAEHQV